LCNSEHEDFLIILIILIIIKLNFMTLPKFYNFFSVLVITLTFNVFNVLGQNFPSNQTYTYGLKPTRTTSKSTDQYNRWLTLKRDCDATRARVIWNTEEYTLSEGIGYAMMITAYKNDIDLYWKFWQYYLNYSGDNEGLMHWKINACGSVAQRGAATDGDLDVAMSLIIASKRWDAQLGSTYYADQAKRIIGLIKSKEVDANGYLRAGIRFGGGSDADGGDVMNPSYFATGYFKAFGDFTNDRGFWDNVVTKCYDVINANLNYAPNAAKGGLVSDWCNHLGQHRPDLANQYGWPDQGTIHGSDASRTPWRIAIDYVWYGDSRAKAYLERVNGFVRDKGGIANIKSKYNMWGTEIEPWHNALYAGSMGLATMAGGSQTELQAAYNDLVSFTGNQYYELSLQTLYVFLMNGDFYNPVGVVSTPCASITRQPVNITVCQGTTGSLSVVATNATSYQWQWSSDNVNWGNAGETGNTTAALATSNTNVFYRVRVSNAQGCSVNSNSVRVTVGTPSVGGTVSPATQTISEGTNNVPTFHTLSGQTGSVVRWEFQMPNQTTWSTWNGTTTTAPSNCCFGGTVGTWKVRAIVKNGNCNEAVSSIGSVIVNPTTSSNTNYTVRARGVASGEQIQLKINGSVKATWTLTTSLANYTVATTDGTARVQFINDNGFRDVFVDYITKGATIYQSENQAINTGFYANGRCGGGGYNELMQCNGYIEYSTPVATAPTAPSNLVANVGSSSQINLKWADNSNNETGFLIERALGTGAFAQIATVGAGIVAYSNTGLTAATTYNYRVRAANSVGNSAYSNSATAKTTSTSVTTISGKFTPPSGKTMMIIGQDLEAITNYTNPVNGFPIPSGVTTYLNLGLLTTATTRGPSGKTIYYGALGLDNANAPQKTAGGFDSDWGAGPLNAYSAALAWSNSTLQIGLYMVGDLSPINSGARDNEIRKLKAFCAKISPKPIYLRIGYEFDGNWNNYDKTGYIAAYKRIVDILRGASGTEAANVAFVWQASTSPVDDIVDGNSENINDWYPGDNYVDWMGMSWFLTPGSAPSNRTTATQISLANEVLNLARTKKKPVMICESTPQGYKIGTTPLTKANVGVWDGTAAQNSVTKTPTEVWNEWFKPYFDYIHANSDAIRAVSYINANWDSQYLWKDYVNSGYWGDSRVQANATIKSNWFSEINTPFWLHGSSALFSQLNNAPIAQLSAGTLEMTAVADINHVRIEWVSNTGDKNDYFAIEKRDETSGSFEKIATLNSKNGDKMEYYTTYDASPIDGDNTYRINLIGKDGATKTSNLSTVKFSKTADFRIFPNPASDFIDVDLKQYEGKAVTLQVYNSFGKLMTTQQVDKATSATVHIELGAQVSGEYLLRVTAQGRRDAVKKFVVQQ
jgi:endo-1,4-beta-D-glucanase Y